jgi:hypothetical protein
MEEAMKTAKLSPDHIRAALRTEEKQIQDLLDAIELNDAPVDAIVDQIRHIELNLRRLRQWAA